MANDTKFRMLVLLCEVLMSTIVLVGVFLLILQGRLETATAMTLVTAIICVWLPSPASLARPDSVKPAALVADPPIGGRAVVDITAPSNR